MRGNLVADYRILRKSAFTLEEGEFGPLDSNERPVFTKEHLGLPEDSTVNNRSKLEFLADPSSSAEHLRFEIRINYRWVLKPPTPQGWPFGSNPPQEVEHPLIYRGELSGGVKRGLWAIIDGGLLLRPSPPWQFADYPEHDEDDTEMFGPDGTPKFPTWELMFHVLDGVGRVTFSNVVLWFHRDLE